MSTPTLDQARNYLKSQGYASPDDQEIAAAQTQLAKMGYSAPTTTPAAPVAPVTPPTTPSALGTGSSDPTAGAVYKDFQTPSQSKQNYRVDQNGNTIITDQYGNELNYGNNTLTEQQNESQIRSQVLAQFQKEIDANNAIYAEKLAEAKQAGLGRLGSGRAIAARSGTLGSDFAPAQEKKITDQNTQIEDSINAELAAKIASITGTAETTAASEIAAKRTAQQNGLDSYLKYLSSVPDKVKTNSQSLAEALISQDISPDQIDPAKYDSILSSYGVTKGDVSTVYNTLKSTKDTAAAKAKQDADKAQSEIDKNNYIPISDGTILYNTKTGKSVENTKDFSPSSSGTGGSAAPVTIDTKSPLYKIAQDLAYGGLTFSQFKSLYSYSRNVGEKIGIYNLASELNPQFNAADFEAGYKFYSNPKTRQQLSAADNALGNIDQIIKLSNDASRTGVTALNKVVNNAGYQIGGKSYANLKQGQELIADEISGVLGYGSGTDMKLKLGIDIVDPNLPPDVFASNMQQLRHFLEQKKGSLLNYTSVYGNGQQNDETTGKIKVQINGTGQTGTIDAADFDAATMTKL